MRNGGTGDAGDPYTGLDRFGRLVETIWKSGADKLVHSRYGRNRVGGVEWRRDEKAHSLTPEVKTQDNYYRYDGLQQVTRHGRGDLIPSSGLGFTGINPLTRQQQEIFTFDETGNWMTDYNSSASLSQSRTQNAANEITALAQATTVVQPTYDPAGNMRTVPQPGNWALGYDLKWDAWNRLVQIKNGATTVASYSYDALTRRTITTIGSTERHYYYDNQWRALEERVKASGTTTLDRQYAWSPFNRWNLIRRKRTTSSSLDETRYVLKDYLDPVALVKIVSSAAVVDERYGYDAFGPVNLMDASFAPRTSSVCDWDFLFHAEFKDLDTGLYNYGYRYYNPELGRWLSRDPIGEEGGLNLYGFVLNLSVNAIDYLGLMSHSIICKRCIKANGDFKLKCTIYNNGKAIHEFSANDYEEKKETTRDSYGNAKDDGKGNEGVINTPNGPLPDGKYEVGLGYTPTFGPDTPMITNAGRLGFIKSTEGVLINSGVVFHVQIRHSLGCISINDCPNAKGMPVPNPRGTKGVTDYRSPHVNVIREILKSYRRTREGTNCWGVPYTEVIEERIPFEIISEGPCK